MNEIRKLIAQNQVPEALDRLRQLVEHSPKLDKAILQSARFHAIRQQIDLGLVSREDGNVEHNQIRLGLLNLLNEIESAVGPTSTLPDVAAFREELAGAAILLQNAGATIKNQFVGGTFHNPTFH